MSWLACLDFYQSTGTLWLRLSYDFALKSVLFLVVVYLLYQVARRLPSAFRHFLLSLAFFCLYLLPFCLIWGPEWEISLFSAPAFLNGAAPNSSSLWPLLLLGIWLAGFAVVMLRLGAGLWMTHRLKRESLPVDDPDWSYDVWASGRKLGFRGDVPVFVNHRLGAAICVGLTRPSIIVPAVALEWSAEQRQTILHHELSHIKRRDNLTNVLALAVCAVYWFNPLVWWAAARLRVCREAACDDLVLNCGTRPSRYVSYLLEATATRHSGLMSVTLSQISVLKKRVLTILDPRVNRRAIGPTQALVCSFLALAAVVSLSALQPWIVPRFTAGLGEKLGLSGLMGQRLAARLFFATDSLEGRGRLGADRRSSLLALPPGFLPAGSPTVFDRYYPTQYTTIYGTSERIAAFQKAVRDLNPAWIPPAQGSGWNPVYPSNTAVHYGRFSGGGAKPPDNGSPSDPEDPSDKPADLAVARVSLGTLGGELSLASDINEAGHVVGASTDGLGTSRPFFWTKAAGMSDLPCPSGDCDAIDINNSGQVLMTASDDAAGTKASYLWSPDDTLTDIGTLGGKVTHAQQVNDRGQVIGTSETSFGIESAFFWSAESGMVNLGGSKAVAVNEKGQVVASASSYAFFWDPSTDSFQRIGALNVQAEPLDLNNRGEVVGYAHIGKNSQPRAFYWNPVDGMTEIEFPGGPTFSCAFRINDAGEVLAMTRDAANRERTFSWRPGQAAQEQTLPDFLVPQLEWELMSSSASYSLSLIGSSLPTAALAAELAKVDFSAKGEPTTLSQLVRMNGRGQIAGNLIRPDRSQIEAVVWEIRLPKVEKSIEEVLNQLPLTTPFSLRFYLENSLAALRGNDYQTAASSLSAFKGMLTSANLNVPQSKQARWVELVRDSLERISHFTVLE